MVSLIKETDSDWQLGGNGTTIFYSKKDRYIIMQLKRVDETAVKYFYW